MMNGLQAKQHNLKNELLENKCNHIVDGESGIQSSNRNFQIFPFIYFQKLLR